MAETHGFDFEVMSDMHDAVEKSLPDGTEWNFKYIAAGNGETTARVFKLMESKRPIYQERLKEFS